MRKIAVYPIPMMAVVLIGMCFMQPWNLAFADERAKRIQVANLTQRGEAPDTRRGRLGDQVEITGQDLIQTGKTTQVIFAETMVANLVEQSGGRLVAEVPPNAYSWPILVKIGNEERWSEREFVVTKVVKYKKEQLGAGIIEFEKEIEVRKKIFKEVGLIGVGTVPVEKEIGADEEEGVIQRQFHLGHKSMDVVTHRKADYQSIVRRPPIFTSMTPTRGEAGTVVTISGANFFAETRLPQFSTPVLLHEHKELRPRVTFNGVEAEHVWVDSNYQIRAAVPLGATTGSVQVIRQGLGENSKLEDKTTTANMTFAVNSPPQLARAQVPMIDSISHEAIARGQEITITGANLKRAGVNTRVYFGDRAGETTFNDGSTLRVKTPYQSGGVFTPKVAVGGTTVEASQEVAVFQVQISQDVLPVPGGFSGFTAKTVPSGYERLIEWYSTGSPSQGHGGTFVTQMPRGTRGPMGATGAKGNDTPFTTICGNFHPDGKGILFVVNGGTLTEGLFIKNTNFLVVPPDGTAGTDYRATAENSPAGPSDDRVSAEVFVCYPSEITVDVELTSSDSSKIEYSANGTSGWGSSLTLTGIDSGGASATAWVRAIDTSADLDDITLTATGANGAPADLLAHDPKVTAVGIKSVDLIFTGGGDPATAWAATCGTVDPSKFFCAAGSTQACTNHTGVLVYPNTAIGADCMNSFMMIKVNITPAVNFTAKGIDWDIKREASAAYWGAGPRPATKSILLGGGGWANDDPPDNVDEDIKQQANCLPLWVADFPGSWEQLHTAGHHYAYCGKFREWVEVKIGGKWYTASKYKLWRNWLHFKVDSGNWTIDGAEANTIEEGTWTGFANTWTDPYDT